MSLYYNKNTHELKELPEKLILEWEQANNPKINDWIIAPDKSSDSAVWNNGVWITPSNSIPETISARQIRLWLIKHNFQLSQIDSTIQSIEDPLIRESVKIEWEYATYIERTHPFLVLLAQSLGLNESDIDRAFIEANIL